MLGRLGDRVAPGELVLVDQRLELAVEHQAGQSRVPVEGGLDVVEEHAADDAACPPVEGDGAEVQIPPVFLRGGSHQHEALGIGDDSGADEGLADILNKIVLAVGVGLLRPVQYDRGVDPVVLDRREGSGEHGFREEGGGNPEIEGRNPRPFSRALLTGCVQDLVEEGRTVIVADPHDVARDLEQVGRSLRLVVGGVYGPHLIVAQVEEVVHELVGFGDHFHVRVFDAVVHHFDEVSGAVLADPRTAGHSGGRPRRNRHKDVLDQGPRGLAAAGHERGAVAGSLFAAGYAESDVAVPCGLEGGRPATGVFVQGVSAVDDDVALFENRQELVDQGVDRRAGLDHQHNLARLFQESHEFLERSRSDDPGLALGRSGKKLVGFFIGPVMHRDRETFVVHVEDKVLPHDRKPDNADIRPVLHTRSPF